MHRFHPFPCALLSAAALVASVAFAAAEDGGLRGGEVSASGNTEHHETQTGHLPSQAQSYDSERDKVCRDLSTAARLGLTADSGPASIF